MYLVFIRFFEGSDLDFLKFYKCISIQGVSNAIF